MSDQIRKLHNTYTSGVYPEKKVSERMQALLDKPHLAVLINGDWLPILPGMIIGFVKDRSKVDGVAPYILTKVNAKTLYEYIDLVAWSTNPATSRKLRLGARYSGTFKSGVTDADQAVDATIAAKKMAAETDEP